MAGNVELYITVDGKARQALSIPIAKCSVPPIKWLLFPGYAIYGQEGHIFLSDGGETISDYTSNVELAIIILPCCKQMTPL